VSARRARLAPVARALAAALVISAATAGAQSLPHVRIVTPLGDIELEIDTVRAPVTGGNFLRYVDGGFFHGGRFMRTVREDNQPRDSVRIAVVQAAIAAGRGREQFPAIPLERTSATGLAHVDGAISMGRLGPDTAQSSFFICVGAQPELDFGGRRQPDGQGFAAFGRVVRGMDVVRRIHASPAAEQRLEPAVPIDSNIRAPAPGPRNR
jgi:peptidyl-prolyl cis-trans isomerase A (cyclophilin A)